MPLALSLCFGFVPMFFFAAFVYWIDRYEKEPLHLLGAAFAWGAIVAAGGAFLINTLLGIGVYMWTESEVATTLATNTIIAPLVEETLKALAVLIVFWRFRSEFDSLIDGAVYAAVTAMGFAATENVYYIFTYGYQEAGYGGLLALAFVRVVLVGWQHPFYTAFTGIGLAQARLSKRSAVRLFAPLGGWVLAVLAHALHNLLGSLLGGLPGLFVTTALDWTGWFFMFVFIIWFLVQEGRLLGRELQDEAAQGILTKAQYDTARSSWLQTGARLGAIGSGRYRQTVRFYQLCAELAHKKNQLTRLGNESGNLVAIERLRAELSSLSAQVR